jgi:two-component system response regulator
VSEKYVLLVEDNADDEVLTVRALQKCRVKNKVIVVRDGEEAVDFILCRGKYSTRDVNDLPQVVLLDLKIPKMNGHEVLKKIRANDLTKLLPVIILTSSKEEKDLVQGYTNGANSYIVKPVDSEQFTASISQLGLYWLVLNETTNRE